jgi:hypothetical protein
VLELLLRLRLLLLLLLLLLLHFTGLLHKPCGHSRAG